VIKRAQRSLWSVLSILCLLSLLVPTPLLYAQEAADNEEPARQEQVAELQAQVKESQAKIKELDATIGSYRKRISEQELQSLSLQNQAALLENRIQEKQLALQKAVQETDLTNLQIRQLDVSIRLEEQAIEKRRAALGELLRRIRQADDVHPFQALITGSSLSEYVAQLDELQRVQQETVSAAKRLHEAKASFQATRKTQDERRAVLLKQQAALERERLAMEGERSAKLSLLATTQQKESEFQRILSELRQQQEGERTSIQDLQERLRDQLNQADSYLARGDVLFQWPVIPGRGISAHFHDKTYPFRKLFEHPGIDLPVSVGTPVKAAAGGYIAWTRVGKQYGNYIMVVHAGGVATVYAHLSRFAVRPDTYVERGQVIGYSGGRPGDEGAGLSTGPHLHFEVRQNGIPVNPENFLPELVTQ
jgi:murein DD-endopeptidase MepM/ murein hydrolase activator NlpD